MKIILRLTLFVARYKILRNKSLKLSCGSFTLFDKARFLRERQREKCQHVCNVNYHDSFARRLI